MIGDHASPQRTRIQTDTRGTDLKGTSDATSAYSSSGEKARRSDGDAEFEPVQLPSSDVVDRPAVGEFAQQAHADRVAFARHFVAEVQRPPCVIDLDTRSVIEARG